LKMKEHTKRRFSVRTFLGRYVVHKNLWLRLMTRMFISPSLSLSLSVSLSVSLSLSHTHTHIHRTYLAPSTYTQTHTNTCTHKHTQTHSQLLSLTHTHTQTHTFAHSFISLTLWFSKVSCAIATHLTFYFHLGNTIPQVKILKHLRKDMQVIYSQFG